MDDGGLQQLACVVDGCPEVVCSGDKDGGVASSADGLLEGVELEVAAGGIVRENACGGA